MSLRRSEMWRDAVELEGEDGRFCYPDGTTELRFTPGNGYSWGDVLRNFEARAGGAAGIYAIEDVFRCAVEFAWLAEWRFLADLGPDLSLDDFCLRLSRFVYTNQSLAWVGEAPMLYSAVLVYLREFWIHGEKLLAWHNSLR